MNINIYICQIVFYIKNLFTRKVFSHRISFFISIDRLFIKPKQEIMLSDENILREFLKKN